jgi:hypothetical protein
MKGGVFDLASNKKGGLPLREGPRKTPAAVPGFAG